VNAVEVTVANHEYGQQLSEQEENTAQNQGKTGKKARRINLDELMDGDGEELDELDDSERIAVEMMQANGNTVDYTA
jgi:flagellar hook-length control protein FliK